MEEMQWLETLYEACRKENARKFPMPPFSEFWKKGYVLFPAGQPAVRHAEFREDAELNALGTPSGFVWKSSAARLPTTAMPTAGPRSGWKNRNARTAAPDPTAIRCGCGRSTRTNACTRRCCDSEPMRQTYAVKGASRYT